MGTDLLLEYHCGRRRGDWSLQIQRFRLVKRSERAFVDPAGTCPLLLPMLVWAEVFSFYGSIQLSRQMQGRINAEIWRVLLDGYALISKFVYWAFMDVAHKVSMSRKSGGPQGL